MHFSGIESIEEHLVIKKPLRCAVIVTRVAPCVGPPCRAYCYQDRHHYCNWTTSRSNLVRECPHRLAPLTRGGVCLCCVFSCQPVSKFS
jgi:hypothetical protein